MKKLLNKNNEDIYFSDEALELYFKKKDYCFSKNRNNMIDEHIKNNKNYTGYMIATKTNSQYEKDSLFTSIESFKKYGYFTYGGAEIRMMELFTYDYILLYDIDIINVVQELGDKANKNGTKWEVVNVE